MSFNDISFREIMAQLGLNANAGLLFNLILYVCFILAMVAFFLQDNKQLPTTLLMGLTLLLIVVAKLYIFRPTDLATLVINAGLFVFPLIVTGMSRAEKSRPFTILGGLMGGVYFFLFWAFLQRGP